MKTRSLMLVPVAALTFLAGCTTQQGQGSGGSMMRGSGGRMAIEGGNSAQMCEMYRQMMAGKSPAEQQSAMEAHMKSMHGSNVTPEQARMHREMMEKNCAGMSTR